jgi:uncharacterized membrane protein
MERILIGTLCTAALGSAIVGGIFYGFSSFVMRALERIAAERGVAAMNAINRVVITPSFMLPFVGTALACVVLVACASVWWDEPSGKLVLAAALTYLGGSFGLTMALHQPMNLKLAALQPAEALAYWPGYVARWTRWNHVRTAASLASALLFVAALVLKPW